MECTGVESLGKTGGKDKGKQVRGSGEVGADLNVEFGRKVEEAASWSRLPVGDVEGG